MFGKDVGEKFLTRPNLNGGDSHNLRNILAGTAQTNNNVVASIQYEGKFGSDLPDEIEKWPDEIVVQKDVIVRNHSGELEGTGKYEQDGLQGCKV